MANSVIYKSDLKKLLMNDLNVTPIKSIRFTIMSDEEKLKRSAYELTSDEIFLNGSPVKGGLADIKGGSTEAYPECGTCHCDPSICPGHFGHLKLNTPVFAPSQFFLTLKKLLTCVCWNCHKVILETNKLPPSNIVSAKKFKYVYDQCHARHAQKHPVHCMHCHFIQPKISRNSGTLHLKITYENEVVNVKDDVREPVEIWVPPVVILPILKGIPNADAIALGFDRKYNAPESLIWNVLVIPPQTIRPAVRYGASGNRGEDDITLVLKHIFKNNQKVQSVITKEGSSYSSASANVFENKELKIDGATFDVAFIAAFTELQHGITALVDNDHGIKPLTHSRSRKPYKTITSRFGGKTGRMRANLLGKRVNHSARTVASADPYLSISEVGIPYKIAMNLTVPEMVTVWNMERMRGYVKNGPWKHPGAIYIRKKGTTTKYGIIAESHLELNIGDIVYRHVVNGDPVLVNRQPTLHRLSMMCHHVRVLPQNTLRLSVLTMPGYAGDFDGDEFNIHCHQSVHTAVELSQLTMPHLQVLRPRNAEPCIAAIQDVPIALYKLSQDKALIDIKDLFNIACRFKGRDFNLLHQMLNPDGKGLPAKVPIATAFKVLFPKGMMVKNGAAHIVDGEVVSTQPIIAKTYNDYSDGILHTVVSEWGTSETRHLLDNTQRLAIEYLMLNGFSVGIKDLLLSEADTAKVNETRRLIMENSTKIIKVSRTREFREDLNDNATFLMKLEQGIFNATKLDTIEEIVKSIDPQTNRFLQLVSSGSKGSTTNLVHMFGIIGQMTPAGARVKAEFDSRTTPHFTKFDLGLSAKGFVQNSYLSGMTPTEFFFAAMKGREGLLDTAVSTSDCGYANRKLVKAMEDLHISQELMVVDANNNVIQFVYGEDGIDINKSERMSLKNFMGVSEEAFKSQYKLKNDSATYTKYVELRNAIAQFTFAGKLPDEFNLHMPINIDKMLLHEQAGTKSELKDADVYDIVSTHVKKNLYINRLNRDKNEDNYTTSLQRCIIMKLSPHKVIVEKQWSAIQLTTFLDKIKERFYASIVHAGEMVGILSAQSVGDRLTQSTLDTFKAVKAADTVLTLSGLPRIKEIMSFTKDIKRPSMRFRLRDIATVESTRRKIELLKLKDVVNKHRLVYCSTAKLIASEGLEGEELERFYRRMEVVNTPDAIAAFTAKPGWFLVLSINHKHLTTDALTIADIEKTVSSKFAIKHQIFSQLPSKIHKTGNIKHNNDIKMIMCMSLIDALEREKLVKTSSMKNAAKDNNRPDIISDLTTLKQALLEKPLSGIPRITKVHRSLQKADMVTSEFKVGPSGFGDYVKNDIVTYTTEGSDMLSVMALADVNSDTVTSNSFHDVADTLGIEAAKYTILNEINLTFNNVDGKHVSDRHILLLADFATASGAFTTFDRTGFAKSDLTGPLAKASFERSSTMLINSATFAEVDNLNGVSANLIFGQLGYGGTAISNVMMDHSKLRHTTLMDYDIIDEKDEDEPVEEINPVKSLETDKLCQKMFAGFEVFKDVSHIVSYNMV